MIWNVPPEHRKTGRYSDKVRPIPITKPMLVVLEEMQKRRVDPSPDAITFPGVYSGGVINAATIANFLPRVLEWKIDVSNHGMRSTLRDWCRANGFPAEYWDIQVDHALGNKTSRAYGHDPLIEERRDMMEKWGEYCSRPAPEPSSRVVVNLVDKRKRRV